ncbi:Fic family protein [uncultured Bacteroides sp.]|uniref:Fic family protein n=1 Tax=uncultured Bacteroides sp. TaxID=162156 RepID=UPI0025830DA6|nr:Fic family protein [uncultured Bacteroides sp.]
MSLCNEILEFLHYHPESSRSEITDGIATKVSSATLKRAISEAVKQNLIHVTGKGKATKYSITPQAHVLITLNIDTYFEKEIDERIVQQGFNFGLIQQILPCVTLFSDEELRHLTNLQNTFAQNVSMLSSLEYMKEMERLGIDLSWKSSQIEGNTYSLLETERLLTEKEEAKGKSKEEAIMLLNHKESLKFILQEPDYLETLTVTHIEDIHSILTKDLNVDRNIRSRRVGITGTNYRPLDNEFQIREAMRDACELINGKSCVFEKALLALVLLSYIQPFADGNKRTARIVSNAILIANKYCPLSFRTVDSIDYKKAMLIFYEQNNISAFKRIFMEQFEFAVNTYF